MSNLEYCPSCIVSLEKNSKKLGYNTIWLKCPKCGFRKRPKTQIEENEELNEFMKNIHKDNDIDEDY